MATDMQSLSQLLRQSHYVLALVGAGLSASSGIPTYKDDGATWRGIDYKQLSTPGAFRDQPELIWEFHKERQREAAAALPNKGHLALAALARAKPGFLTVSQNVDDLSQRASHPSSQLASLHGSLFTIKCLDEDCAFPESLVAPSSVSDCTIPHCLRCGGLLRPGVVWFGELLPEALLGYIDSWVDSVPYIDAMLVVGTTAELSRSAELVDQARDKGAVIAHFNTCENEDIQEPEDLFFQGDAAETLPLVIQGALSDISRPSILSAQNRMSVE